MPLCILLDLMLKDGDGLDLCDEIKGSPSLQHLPIVILSGRQMTALECLKHQALYHVQKDTGAEDELAAALESILAQRERTQGVIDAGDLRLDPRNRIVSLSGQPIATLHQGPFAALMLLVQSAPRPVAEERLYTAFLERAPHNKADPELSARSTVRNYISRLRRNLGEVLAARITFVHGEGYVYHP